MVVFDDTIAAISTPLGEGGIGIVRLSGPEAIPIVDKLFRGRKKIEGMRTYSLIHGRIVENGEEIDEVLVSLMRSPNSYTGEDVVEINCHGGVLVTRRVLEAALKGGARLAEKGEFTKRAFLNGRMDLAQAEAVVDMVRARASEGLRSAYFQMRGELSRRLREIKDRLTECLALLELSLDFSEEDVDFVEGEEVCRALSGVIEDVDSLADSFRHGRLVREGIKAVLVGKPNVGKSSILNALLNEERAIVTPVPGTTRDSIEEWLEIEGVGFNLIDTAGLRETGDLVEVEGSRRTMWHLEDAEILIVVLDASEELNGEDMKVSQAVDGRRKVIVLNKCDLERRLAERDVVLNFGDVPMVEMSAKERWGLEKLREEMAKANVRNEVESGDGVVVTRARHVDCLRRTSRSLSLAEEALKSGLSFEYVAFDIREALESLGEIVGETTAEDVLNRIFEEFCIGK